jgi:serine/threonine protein kinase
VDRLGDFEIDGVLGEGGSAIVYAARRDGDELALKVLRPELLLSEREVGSFLAEAHRAQRVAHPSLVEIRDAGVLPDGRPYLAMPRLRGECLAERVARGPMDLASALRLFHGLSGAVSALHAAGLVHRDIKPENMFVVGGEEEHLVLLDLGIARDIDAPASTTTQAGLVRGTPAYMAPERFFGARASTLTDTYEAAVTLYVMLTGRLPWDHAQEARGRMSPRDPRSLVPLPEPVAKALLRALSVDETARPEGVRALHDELEQAAVSTADTQLLVASSSAMPAQNTPPARAISIRPPEGTTLTSASNARDLGTQDTVALSTGRSRRRGAPAWVPAVMSACVIAGAGAGVWVFLLRTPAKDAVSDAPSAQADATAATSGIVTAPSPPASPSSAAAVVTAAPDVSTSAAATSAAPSASVVPAATSIPAAPRPAGPGSSRPSAASATATSSAASGRPPSLGAGVPDCLMLLNVVCAADYAAVDQGAQCAHTRALIQSAMMKAETEWPAMNAGCSTARLSALQLMMERQRAKAKAGQ